MILDKVLALYDTEEDLLKRRRPSKGNPTASSVGNCLAQQQMLRMPALTKPELRPVRTAWVFEDGDLHAADLKAKIMRAFPGLSGLSEELFYGPVPVAAEEETVLAEMVRDGRLWGTILRGFVPPKLTPGTAGEKPKVRLAPRDPRNPDRPRPMGFVLDPGSGTMWAPLYVDHVVHHPERGAVVAEFKSMSRFAFRRALLGQMDMKNRMQLALIAEATDLDCVWFVKAKDTAHLLEIDFLRSAEKGVRVTLLKTNGAKAEFFVPEGADRAQDSAGNTVELQEGEDWDAGEVWTPWDPSLLAEAKRRVLRVLLHEPSAPWDREYGPSFECGRCGGTGTQTMAKGGGAPLKKPKPCEDCGAAGKLGEADLPNFPCGYCPVVRTCYPFARLELTDKPRWIVSRKDWEASGFSFQAPEGA